MENRGVIIGEVAMKFQSRVGRGVIPRPVTVPVIMASFALVGEIQVVQLKKLRDWKTIERCQCR
jgi:hypothetical protein